MDKIQLIVLVGLPGSGKSYYAGKLRNQLPEGSIILSSDDLREELFGDATDQAHNQEIFRELYARMNLHLAGGTSVILDATNTTRKSRSHIFANLRVKSISVAAHVLCTPHFRCVTQDQLREQPVGLTTINKFFHSFQAPQPWEGFDDIKFIRGPLEVPEDQQKEDLYNLLDDMKGWDQTNPHHKYSLGEHNQRCAALFERQLPSSQASLGYTVGLLHDVGKLFTRSTDQEGIAHYYNHANVGTYLLICHPWYIEQAFRWKQGRNITPEEFLEVVFFINYHMVAHTIQSGTKAGTKWKHLLGEERFQALMCLRDCEVAATGE